MKNLSALPSPSSMAGSLANIIIVHCPLFLGPIGRGDYVSNEMLYKGRHTLHYLFPAYFDALGGRF